MSRQQLSFVFVLGGFCLAAGCAGILGIEDAECDPSFSGACSASGSINTGGSAGNPSSVLPLMPGNGGGNGGSSGSPAVAATAGAGGASVASGGSGGSAGSAAGAGGSSMAMGTAGSASMGVDPIEARATPLCLEYCQTVGASCTGTNQQYASDLACLAVCELLPPGTANAVSGNSVQCRLGRAELAATTGEGGLYCTSAGPGGANVCGSDCDGYCALMTAKCTREIGNLDQCTAACSIVPDLSQAPTLQKYNVSMQSGNSIQCRLFHVSASTLDPTLHCPHAAGQTPCF